MENHRVLIDSNPLISVLDTQYDELGDIYNDCLTNQVIRDINIFVYSVYSMISK